MLSGKKDKAFVHNEKNMNVGRPKLGVLWSVGDMKKAMCSD